jgi:DNA-binding HxlR family transcriptional regulator
LQTSSIKKETIKKMAKFNKEQANPKENPVSYVMNLIGGKWKPIIIWAIHSGHNRFGEMQRQISGITKKMLTNQLRELEADGLITRKVFPVVPPKVEYGISKKGMLLGPLLELMCDLGEQLKKADEQE